MMTILVAGTAATWGMVGVIWMVQLVQYPMLLTYGALAPGDAFAEHQRRISWVVGPLMAVEGVSTLLLLAVRPETMAAWTAWMAAVMLAVALGSTVLIQVPLHARLAEGQDDGAARRLITTNWARTVAWTARGLLLVWVLAT